MKHEILDRRALTFARVIVWLIDHDPTRKGLNCARQNLINYPRNAGYMRWRNILYQPWAKARKQIIAQTEEMQYLRQMTPFYGESCLPEILRQRIVNKYLHRNGHEKIDFLPLQKLLIAPPDHRFRKFKPGRYEARKS